MKTIPTKPKVIKVKQSKKSNSQKLFAAPLGIVGYQEMTLLNACEDLLKIIETEKICKKQLAQKMNLSERKIDNLLRGIKRPTLDEISAIAYHINCKSRIIFCPSNF